MVKSKKDLTKVRYLLQSTSQDWRQLNAPHASDEFCLAIKFPCRPKRLRASVCPWLFILMLAFGVQSVSAQTVWSEGVYYPTATT